MPTKKFANCLVAVVAIGLAGVAVAHIKVFPSESTLGAREKYVMRVPNEKQVATVRIDGEFPPGLKIYSFESKPGWKVDIRKDASGNIVGATWIGSIAPLEFVEFGMLGINPQDGAQLIWKFVQHYADGKTEEFVGPAGSRLPAPSVTLKATK
jgi:hypothetical protein